MREPRIGDVYLCKPGCVFLISLNENKQWCYTHLSERYVSIEGEDKGRAHHHPRNTIIQHIRTGEYVYLFNLFDTITKELPNGWEEGTKV
jgi:hypothetical protein